IATRQLGACCHTVAGTEPGHAGAGLENACAEFMPEKLEGRLRLQAALDTVVSQRRDSLGQLRFRNARLHTERFDQNMAGQTRGLRYLLEPHIVEAIESPGSHGSLFPAVAVVPFSSVRRDGRLFRNVDE